MSRTCGWCEAPATDHITYTARGRALRSHVCAAHVRADLGDLEAIALGSDLEVDAARCSGGVLDVLAEQVRS